MKIGFFLSNKGGSPLQVGLERGLLSLGHQVENYRPGGRYQLVLVFNQSAHTTDYAYPDCAVGYQIAFIDTAEYGYFKRLPGVIGKYANAFSAASMDHDTKNRHQQERLRRMLEGRSFPYFIREFSSYVSFPQGYHPIDYPLYEGSVCHQPPNREEYLRRELDLFVSWGASHPFRMGITQALRDCHTKCEINIIGENGWPRMNQEWYLGRTRAAKVSVSFDGYGSSSFRLHEVLVRTVLLMGPLSIRRYAPLTDGVDCVVYDVESEGEDFKGTNICKKLREILADPERAYRIYEAGYHRCMEHYTEQATAKYVLKVVSQHDWSKPTQLDV